MLPHDGSNSGTTGIAVVPPAPDWLTLESIHPGTGMLSTPIGDAEATAFRRFLRTQRTGRDAWRRAPYASWMLCVAETHAEWLHKSAVRPLRAFAHAWVFAAGVPLQELVGPTAVTFDIDGAARCDPAALARLAAFHAASDQPRFAAFWSAEYSARRSAVLAIAGRAAEWTCRDPVHRDLDPAWHLAHYVHHHPHAFRAALMQARGRQAVLLRKVLPDPFGEPWLHTRVEVCLETRADIHQRVYCVACAAGLQGMSPAVLLDGRWGSCAGCGAKLLTRVARSEA